MNAQSDRACVVFPATNYVILDQDLKTGLDLMIGLIAHGDQTWEVKLGDKLSLMLPVRGPATLEVLNLENKPAPFVPMKAQNGVPGNASWLHDAPAGASFQTTDHEAIDIVEAQRATIMTDLRSFAANNKIKVLIIGVAGQTVHLWKSPEGIHFTLSR
jgi:hypothetical protein